MTLFHKMRSCIGRVMLMWLGRLYFALILIFLMFGMTVSAEENKSGYVEARVAFHINRHDIDLGYGDNLHELSKIDKFIAEADSSIVITDIIFSGYASPDGRESFNNKLAWARVNSLEDYFNRQILIKKGDSINASDLCKKGCVASLPALNSLIVISDIQYKEKALQILNDTLLGPSSRLLRLKDENQGAIWTEIKPLLGELRYATVTVRYKMPDRVAIKEPPARDIAEKNVDTIPSDDISYIEPVDVDSIAEYVLDYKDCKPLYVSLKSNLLYDALLIPSIGAEVYVGRMFTINANWSYAWWSSDRRHDYWRYYGGDIALRRWFGRRAEDKPLTGHHLGLYAQLFTYDFEFGGKGQMGHKYNYAGGIEYGFALPISRRLNLDFSVGVGFLWGEYHEYTPIDGHYVWQATKRRNWFGPTKAEVSLVWLIGCGNSNPLKGGDR